MALYPKSTFFGAYSKLLGVCAYLKSEFMLILFRVLISIAIWELRADFLRFYNGLASLSDNNRQCDFTSWDCSVFLKYWEKPRISPDFSSVQAVSGSKFLVVNHSKLCLLPKHCRRWRRLDCTPRAFLAGHLWWTLCRFQAECKSVNNDSLSGSLSKSTQCSWEFGL